ncbi:MAG: EamA family transporter RarD [Nocardioidaceae bacterium]|nr:EamA family transporter RarD [Nocardioidaceae bacterium]
MSEERRGLWLGVVAYVLWGLFPLYWPLLEPAGAIEILAHRVLWSLVLMVGVLLLLRRVGTLRAIWAQPRIRYSMMGAGVVIGLNWGTYIWGVNNGHVVETALGYYINPLVTVLLGVTVLGEHLRRWQWVALAIGTGAVVVLTLELGRLPWIALILAFSFALYGLLKKTAGTGPVEGLTYEGFVLAPIALAYVSWLSLAGQAQAWSHGVDHVALLATTGLVTAIPLLCFAGAANRIALSTLGLLQYIGPTLQFLIGVLLYDEPMPAVRWAGFSLVWLALVVLTVDSVVAYRGRDTTSAADDDTLDAGASPRTPRGEAVEADALLEAGHQVSRQ